MSRFDFPADNTPANDDDFSEHLGAAVMEAIYDSESGRIPCDAAAVLGFVLGVAPRTMALTMSTIQAAGLIAVEDEDGNEQLFPRPGDYVVLTPQGLRAVVVCREAEAQKREREDGNGNPDWN